MIMFMTMIMIIMSIMIIIMIMIMIMFMFMTMDSPLGPCIVKGLSERGRGRARNISMGWGVTIHCG